MLIRSKLHLPTISPILVAWFFQAQDINVPVVSFKIAQISICTSYKIKRKNAMHKIYFNNNWKSSIREWKWIWYSEYLLISYHTRWFFWICIERPLWEKHSSNERFWHTFKLSLILFKEFKIKIKKTENNSKLKCDVK